MVSDDDNIAHGLDVFDRLAAFLGCIRWQFLLAAFVCDFWFDREGSAFVLRSSSSSFLLHSPLLKKLGAIGGSTFRMMAVGAVISRPGLEKLRKSLMCLPPGPPA